MNWRQVNKKMVKCLITAFSFQAYLQLEGASKLMLYHRNGPRPRASHKNKQEEEGLGWKNKITKVSLLLK